MGRRRKLNPARRSQQFPRAGKGFWGVCLQCSVCFVFCGACIPGLIYVTPNPHAFPVAGLVNLFGVVPGAGRSSGRRRGLPRLVFPGVVRRSSGQEEAAGVCRLLCRGVLFFAMPCVWEVFAAGIVLYSPVDSTRSQSF